MRIINVNPVPPYPLVTGGHVRAYALLERLRQRHDVITLCFQRSQAESEAISQLVARGWDIRPVPFARFHPTQPAAWPILARHARAWAGSEPAGVVHWDQPAMRAALTKIAGDADVIHAEYSYLAPCLRAVRPPTGRACKRPVLVSTAHDVYSVTLARQADLATNLWSRLRLRCAAARFSRYETKLGSWLDGILAMSDVDATALHRLNPHATIRVIPNGVDTVSLQPGPVSRKGRHLLFIGSPRHPPNLDAAVWLLTAIWPAVYRRCPEASLTLVNMDVPAIRTLADGQAGVEVTGQVPDVVPYYEQADVCLAPIRAGSGTRLKILEAMALGVPVLSTPIGAEGLEVIPDYHLVLADDAEMLVEKAVVLLADADCRARLATAARKLVEDRYDWDRITAQVEQLYVDLAAQAEDKHRMKGELGDS